MITHWPLLESVLGLAGWTVVRATLLLAGALLLALVLRPSSAAARHALWTVTFGGLLLLPVLSMVLPPVPVELPGPEVVTRILGGGGGPGLEWGGGDASDGTVPSPETVAAPEAVAAPEVLPVGPHPEAETHRGERAQKASPSLPAAPTAGGGGSALLPRGAVPMGLLLLLWTGGVLALSVPLALGLARARRMCLRALPLGDMGWPVAPWMAALERAAAKVGLRRLVSLRVSSHARTALAGGVRRPVVLLPDDAAQWSDERRDLVLTHELVHLRRLDPVRQVCGRLVLALYWFHPLAWWAVRAASIAREEACDEAVLRLGHRPSTYARHLVELAAVRRRPLPAMSAMHSPHLEKRIMTILHASHHGNGPRRRRWAIAGSTTCAAAWALSVTLVVPVERAVAAAPDGATVEAAAQMAPPAAVLAPTPAAPPAPPPPDAPPPDAPEPTPSVAFPAPSGPAAPPHAVPEPDPRCAPLRVGPGREAAAERRAEEVEPVLSTVLDRPDGTWLCIQRRGAAQFGPDGRLLSSLPDGDWLVVAGTDGHGQRRVEMEGRDGAPDTFWLVDGEEHPYGEEAQAWLVGALQQLDRHRTVLPVRPLREVRPLPDTVPDIERLRRVVIELEEAIRRIREQLPGEPDVERARREVLDLEEAVRRIHEQRERRREEAGVGSPMIVVDGVVVDPSSERLESVIDPERIERVEVIRGAEAPARYGSRARDGIVMITTIRR